MGSETVVLYFRLTNFPKPGTPCELKMQLFAAMVLGIMSICTYVGQVESTAENWEWLAQPPKFDKLESRSSVPQSVPKNDDKRLVMFNMVEGPKWMTRKELKEIHAKGGLINYMDLTDSPP